MESEDTSRGRARYWLIGGAAALLGCLLLALTVDVTPAPWRRFFGLWDTSRFVLGAGLIAAGVAVAGASFLRQPLPTLILGCMLGGLTWVLLELPALLGVVSYPVLFQQDPGRALGTYREPHMDVKGEAPPDTASIWGLPFESIPFHYTTDRHGLRNAHDREQADLYVLGDSFIVSGLVPIEETLVARLERHLERPAMAIALNGLGVQAAQELFDELSLPLEGALVLQAVYEGNDLLDSRYFRDPSASEPTRLARSFLLNALRWVRDRTQRRLAAADLQVCSIDGRTVTFSDVTEAFPDVTDELPFVLDALDEFDARVRAKGGHYAVVVLPNKLRVLGSRCDWPEGSALGAGSAHLGPLPERVARFGSEAGIPVLDLTDTLEAAAAGDDGLPWFDGDRHWNGRGQAAAAERIIAWEPVRRWARAPHGSR